MKNTKGFTLTEIMIVLGISALVSIPLYHILSDQSKQTYVLQARDYIKRESDKVFKLLENDLSQAKKGTFSQQENEFSIKVRTKEVQNLLLASSVNDATLKYTFEKPKLYRDLIDGNNAKRWLVSSSVDSIQIDEPSPAEARTSPGKMLVSLKMKSNLVGIKDNDQPVYEQNKVIIIKEDATSLNDPNWLDVGTVGGLFQTSGNLLQDLKEQFIALGNNFIGVWAGALGDISNMTVGQLKDLIGNLSLDELRSSIIDVQSSLNELMSNLDSTNKQIDNLGWQALYDQMEVKVKKSWFGLKVTTNEDEVKKDSERKEQMANNVKSILSGYTSKSQMNWNAVRSAAGSELNEDGEKVLKSFYEAKESSFDGINQLNTAKSLLNDQLNSLQN